jgi:tRNA(Ile)-lysidine synthase
MKVMVNIQMMLQNYFTLKDIRESEKYVLGFSGGPDSTFLFFHLLKEIGNKNFVVAHVNYHLRDGSDEAQKLVENFCKENDVEFFVLEVNKNKNDNTERWAREIRYEFFEKVALQKNYSNILIAHNWNDDLETFIFQNERGNYVTHYGLKNISTRNGFNIIRPMLEIKKSEVNNWVKENELKVDFDITNEDISFARNKIRMNFENYDIEKLERIKISKNRMMGWVYDKIEPMLKSEFLIEDFIPLNDKEEIVFVFEFLKRFVPNYNISDMKKNITGEIARVLRSDKNYIRINLNQIYSIIKDRNNVFVFENSKMNVSKKITSLSDVEQLEFKNKNEIKEMFEKFGPLVVTNDWMNYQSKLIFKTKSLKKYFNEKKISYRWKLENAIIYLDGENNILNKTI